MIPTKSNDVTVQGNFSGQSTAMGIDPGSLVHLQSILTNLYSDPVLAVIREYSTNALDAHRASGQTRPIEVTLPSAFSPSFVVKDYGIGMSVDDIQKIYSQYGASTKRETNDQTGMLGLGSKAALSYSPSFSVTAIQAGVKTVALVSRSDETFGVVNILDTLSTDEPDGVEISVPVAKAYDYPKFAVKAEKFFMFWKSGEVLVNEQEPVWFVGVDAGQGAVINVHPITGKVDKRIGESVIVMGGVTYPWPGIVNDYGLVVFAPMGAVDFTPAREELHMTQRTDAFIRSYSKIKREDAFANHITKFSTLKEAYVWASTIDKSSYKSYQWNWYRQIVVTRSVVSFFVDNDRFQQNFNIFWNPNLKRIINWPEGRKPTYRDRQKLATVSSNGFVTFDDSHHWQGVTEEVDWLTIKDIKLPPKEKRPEGPPNWHVFDRYGMMELKNKFDKMKKVLWIKSQEIDADRREVLKDFAKAYYVISVPVNRQGNFHKQFPGAEQFVDKLKRIPFNPTRYYYQDINKVRAILNANTIEDPRFQEFMNQAGTTAPYDDFHGRNLMAFGIRGDQEVIRAKFLEEYSLLDRLSHYYGPGVAEYINLIFRERNRKLEQAIKKEQNK